MPKQIFRLILLIILLVFIMWCVGTSCATTKYSVEEQRRGLLLIEKEDIHKNKGFYKNQSKNHRKIKRQQKRY